MCGTQDGILSSSLVMMSMYDVVEDHATLYIHRTKVMLSIHVATISVQARRLDHVDKTFFN